MGNSNTRAISCFTGKMTNMRRHPNTSSPRRPNREVVSNPLRAHCPIIRLLHLEAKLEAKLVGYIPLWVYIGLLSDLFYCIAV